MRTKWQATRVEPRANEKPFTLVPSFHMTGRAFSYALPTGWENVRKSRQRIKRVQSSEYRVQIDLADRFEIFELYTISSVLCTL